VRHRLLSLFKAAETFVASDAEGTRIATVLPFLRFLLYLELQTTYRFPHGRTEIRVSCIDILLTPLYPPVELDLLGCPGQLRNLRVGLRKFSNQDRSPMAAMRFNRVQTLRTIQEDSQISAVQGLRDRSPVSVAQHFDARQASVRVLGFIDNHERESFARSCLIR